MFKVEQLLPSTTGEHQLANWLQTELTWLAHYHSRSSFLIFCPSTLSLPPQEFLFEIRMAVFHHSDPCLCWIINITILFHCFLTWLWTCWLTRPLKRTLLVFFNVRHNPLRQELQRHEEAGSPLRIVDNTGLRSQNIESLKLSNGLEAQLEWRWHNQICSLSGRVFTNIEQRLFYPFRQIHDISLCLTSLKYPAASLNAPQLPQRPLSHTSPSSFPPLPLHHFLKIFPPCLTSLVLGLPCDCLWNVASIWKALGAHRLQGRTSSPLLIRQPVQSNSNKSLPFP